MVSSVCYKMFLNKPFVLSVVDGDNLPPHFWQQILYDACWHRIDTNKKNFKLEAQFDSKNTSFEKFSNWRYCIERLTVECRFLFLCVLYHRWSGTIFEMRWYATQNVHHWRISCSDHCYPFCKKMKIWWQVQNIWNSTKVTPTPSMVFAYDEHRHHWLNSVVVMWGWLYGLWGWCSTGLPVSSLCDGK